MVWYSSSLSQLTNTFSLEPTKHLDTYKLAAAVPCFRAGSLQTGIPSSVLGMHQFPLQFIRRIKHHVKASSTITCQMKSWVIENAQKVYMPSFL